MDIFGPWHLLIVAGVFVMLFGAKRLPDAARSLGKSAHILKSEIKTLHDDDKSADASRVPVTPALSQEKESLRHNDSAVKVAAKP